MLASTRLAILERCFFLETFAGEGRKGEAAASARKRMGTMLTRRAASLRAPERLKRRRKPRLGASDRRHPLKGTPVT